MPKKERMWGRSSGIRRYVQLRCKEHPKYLGSRRQRKLACPSCQLILILANQHEPHPDTVLGGLDPYQFIPDLQEACQGLRAVQEMQFVAVGVR